MESRIKLFLENLSRYRNLWLAGYHTIAGENIYKTLIQQVITLQKENEQLRQEILKLSQRGEN